MEQRYLLKDHIKFGAIVCSCESMSLLSCETESEILVKYENTAVYNNRKMLYLFICIIIGYYHMCIYLAKRNILFCAIER
jgi:hypothetical protein